MAQISRTLPGGAPAELSFVLSIQGSADPNSFSVLDFGTDALGIPIQPGTYTDAQRASFASTGHPGLDVTLDSRGSNTLTGSFTITDVSFFQDGGGALRIGTFSASFEQHSEGFPPALFGTLDYVNSAVPEPASFAMLGTGVIGMIGFLRRRAARPRRLKRRR